jgi:hypothetical protein
MALAISRRVDAKSCLNLHREIVHGDEVHPEGIGAVDSEVVDLSVVIAA